MYTIFSRKSAVFFLKVLGAALAMGGLVWYNCPSIQEWAAMTFLMRIYWLVWLIGLAAVVLFRRIGALGCS